MRLIDADVMRADWLENGQNEYVYDTNAVLDSIDEQPTIEAEPVRHGRWKEEFWTIERQRVCSVCIRTVRQPAYDNGDAYLFKYCPYCGAKMDLEN